MKKKNSLPDSLELLLDTMCNTFGGIIFIAISLIVISQIISQVQLTMTPEDINEKNMQQMQEKIDKCQKEILEIKKEILDKQLHNSESSPEKLKEIKILVHNKEENTKIQGEIDSLIIKILSMQKLLERLTNKFIEKQKIFIEKQSNINLKRKKILAQQKELEKQIKNLDEKLKNTKPKELRFAKEKSTNLDLYWVFLKNNKIYRRGSELSPFKNEVRITVTGHTGGYFTPLKGTSLSENPENELNYLFKNVNNKRYFIRITADYNSFYALLSLKQYLRNRKFLVDWAVNPNYEFSYTSSKYSASE